MKTYTDAVFDGIRARGWKLRLFAYVGRNHCRMFCADAERPGAQPLISHSETMLGALLSLDAKCQASENGRNSDLPLDRDALFAA